MDPGLAGFVGENTSWGATGKRDQPKEAGNVVSLPLKRRKHSALIVEDDMTSIYVLDLALQQTGQFAKLDWATSAEEAMGYISRRLQAGKTTPYDLIIIDIFLDGRRTGVDLWQYLCEANIQHVPVIMTSGISEQRFAQLMGRYAVAPKFLKKPFKMQVCIDTIEAALHQPKIH